jgi:hypothetical protein
VRLNVHVPFAHAREELGYRQVRRCSAPQSEGGDVVIDVVTEGTRVSAVWRRQRRSITWVLLADTWRHFCVTINDFSLLALDCTDPLGSLSSSVLFCLWHCDISRQNHRAVIEIAGTSGLAFLPAAVFRAQRL